MVCSNGELIDAQTYEALHTSIDIDGLYDLLEMKQVRASWAAADVLNVKERAP